MAAPVPFSDRLQSALQRKRTPVVVGLDPHVALLPREFEQARTPGAPRAARASCIADFLCEVIDVVAPQVPAVKPQSALFELFGADGVASWERVVRHARRAGLLVIGDVKRGDIASSARAYARAFLDRDEQGDAACDAITINPYLGSDSVEPFLELCREQGAGLFVLVRTSNPGSADFQTHGSPALALRVAEFVDQWGASLVGECGLSSVGAVVGATQHTLIRELRERMPRSTFLLPGYGAQGASARDVAAAFLPDGSAPRGALINSSRGICFAWREARYAGMPWQEACAAATRNMIEELDVVVAPQ